MKKGAFSLAEVLLALALVAIVVLLLVALGISSLRGSRQAQAISVGQAYASSTLEQFVYSLPPSDSSFWRRTAFDSPYRQDQSEVGSIRVSSQTFVQIVDATTPGLLRCTVNASWSSGSNQGAQNISVSRLVYAP